jgi:hypothetical protein
MCPVTLVQSWRKLLPNLDDLQRFPNEEIRKFEIPDMVSVIKSSENTGNDNNEE